MGNPLAASDSTGESALGDWINEQWGKIWGGKGKGVGKAMGVDAAGRILGAKCAKDCKPFKSTRDKTDVATEICLDLAPGVQADIYSGSAVLQSCVKHCLEFIGKECPCVK